MPSSASSIVRSGWNDAVRLKATPAMKNSEEPRLAPLEGAVRQLHIADLQDVPRLPLRPQVRVSLR